MHFRHATTTDLPLIVSIYNSTVASRMVTADTEPVTIVSREGWFAEHSPEKWPLLMVEDGANAVGWVSFQAFYNRPAYDATAEISIYLSEGSRGKGYGRQVLDYCLGYAPSLGITTIVGFIFAHNTPSLKLFAEAGFTVWGHLPAIALLDGVERSVCIVGKRLGM